MKPPKLHSPIHRNQSSGTNTAGDAGRETQRAGNATGRKRNGQETQRAGNATGRKRNGQETQRAGNATGRKRNGQETQRAGNATGRKRRRTNAHRRKNHPRSRKPAVTYRRREAGNPPGRRTPLERRPGHQPAPDMAAREHPRHVDRLRQGRLPVRHGQPGRDGQNGSPDTREDEPSGERPEGIIGDERNRRNRGGGNGPRA